MGKAPEATDPAGATARSTLTQRLAKKLSDRLEAMQGAGQLPAKSTCDMLVLDRWVGGCHGCSLCKRG